MAREARSNRGSEQWPVRRSTDEATRSRLRALFIPTDATEGAVEELAAAHARELQEGLTALRDAVSELESREQAVSELEEGVEQILRDGSVELDRFQLELESRAAALDARDRTLAQAESVVEERRRELGAVELKRAAMERRSAGLEERESALERRADELADLARELHELGGTLADREHPGQELEPSAHVLLTTHDRYRTVAADGPPPRLGYGL